MKIDLPELKRCCFCLPLRHGLLAWGYFKMISDVFFITVFICTTINTINMIIKYANGDYINRMLEELTISIIVIAIFFADLIATIVFIVGGHKKNAQLMKAMYFVGIGMWIVTFLLTSFAIILTIQNFHPRILYPVCFYFVVLAVQTYFLLLLRSEIIKLRNNGEFRFVNNAVEAECTMKCEDVVVGTDTVKQDI